MKKVIVLVSALLLGFVFSANAQDNKSTKSPRETHNVSSRPASSQSPRSYNSRTESNSRRPTATSSQQSSSRQQSTPRATNSSNNNDRVQRDATKNSQYQFGKPRN